MNNSDLHPTTPYEQVCYDEYQRLEEKLKKCKKIYARTDRYKEFSKCVQLSAQIKYTYLDKHLIKLTHYRDVVDQFLSEATLVKLSENI